MTTEHQPPRHLHPVEPPFDPELDAYDLTAYDAAGTDQVTTPTGPRYDRDAIYDNAAERALLNLLVHDHTIATRVHAELQPSDFYRPEHEHIWNTYHQMHHADGTPPDAITLAAQLAADGNHRAVRAFTDLAYDTTLTTSAIHADGYIRIIRDHARIRTAQAAVTQLQHHVRTATPDTLDRAFADALDTLEQTALRFGPSTTSTPTGLVDLSWVATTGQAPEQPTPVYCRRTDGTALFYKGKVNGIFGDPESGKTWAAQIAIVEALNTPHETAAFIDVDHNGADATAARLILLGAPLNAIADPNRFRYYSPEDRDELLAAVDDVTARCMDVVLIDSIGEVFPMMGVSTNDSDELSTALRLVCTRPANAGACVITVDHLPKGADARATGFAIGGIAKKRMIRGAYIRAEVKTQPAPGAIGRVALRIEKDTTGELRKTSPGGYAGTLILDSTDDYTTRASINLEQTPKNADGTFRPTVLMELVSRYVEDNDQCTGKDIENAVAGKASMVRKAIELLVHEGYITRVTGARNAKLHHSLIHYRQADDDHMASS